MALSDEQKELNKNMYKTARAGFSAGFIEARRYPDKTEGEALVGFDKVCGAFDKICEFAHTIHDGHSRDKARRH